MTDVIAVLWRIAVAWAILFVGWRVAKWIDELPEESMTEFGRLDANGLYTRIREIPQEAFTACPHYILVAEHYREDNSCKCSNAEHREMMKSEWGYSDEDFVGVPLVD